MDQQIQLAPGLGLIFFAAICGGAFALPLRIRRRYEVENTVVIAHLFAMILIPLIVAQFVLHTWPGALRSVGGPMVLTVAAFGFGWGCGAVTFSYGIATLGLGLGFAIIMGLNTAVGSIIPMIKRWDQIPGAAKLVILLGILVVLAGVVVLGKAGILRERGARPESGSATGSSSGEKAAMGAFAVGLAWCILSGFLSACANLGFDHAEPIGKAAAPMLSGMSAQSAEVVTSMIRWIPLYWGGYAAILIFLGGKMLVTGTWKNYSGPGAAHDFPLAVMMGCLHWLAQIPYGMGAVLLGKLGTSVGWAINIAFSLIIANILGIFATREWKGAPKSAINTLIQGLVILVVAGLILAYGNYLATILPR